MQPNKILSTYSNVPGTIHFGVFLTHSFRFINICSRLHDFIVLMRRLAAIFRREGFQLTMLKQKIREFLLSKRLQLIRYEIFVDSPAQIGPLVQQFFA